MDKVNAEILEAFCRSYTDRPDIQPAFRYANLAGALQTMLEMAIVHKATPDQVAQLMIERMERNLASV